MRDLISEQQGKLFIITLNRPAKYNAFDDLLLKELQNTLNEALQTPEVDIILLKANGKHFSAGADAHWMKKMAHYSEEENFEDAMVLAEVIYTLYNSPKPTIAMVQGCAYGGGAGLAAACDIVIASDTACFCFSEAKLGLIPAVISPYVIKAIGERATKWLFMTAETLDAQNAKSLGLIHHCIPENELLDFTLNYAENMSRLAPKAVKECKALVESVKGKPINGILLEQTASLIAKKRISDEGQRGLHAFIHKETPNWN